MSAHDSPKRVVVDINPAPRCAITGTEVYTREVCRRLPGAAPERQWRFLASRARGGLGVDLTVLPWGRLWSQVRLPIAMARSRADLLFVPAHAIPFAWPGKMLTVVHDLAFERHPRAYSSQERVFLQLSTRWAIMRCPLLIAVSESTKADLVGLYGVAAERVRALPLSPSPPPSPPPPHSPPPHLGPSATL